VCFSFFSECHNLNKRKRKKNIIPDSSTAEVPHTLQVSDFTRFYSATLNSYTIKMNGGPHFLSSTGVCMCVRENVCAHKHAHTTPALSNKLLYSRTKWTHPSFRRHKVSATVKYDITKTVYNHFLLFIYMNTTCFDS
jgi:hypothetical protein